jgi:Tat protein secretion system quality control protein TatD with DNase activity
MLNINTIIFVLLKIYSGFRQQVYRILSVHVVAGKTQVRIYVLVHDTEAEQASFEILYPKLNRKLNCHVHAFSGKLPFSSANVTPS